MSANLFRRAVAETLEVVTDFDPRREVNARAEFLAHYLLNSGAKGFVLGISGGVDSLTTGRLAQLAVTRLRGREVGHADAYEFVPMRLPYHAQKDEDDAQLALSFIGAGPAITVDIGPATDRLALDISAAGAGGVDDFHLGNIKARQRMVAQYAVAGQRNLLVLGTDHAAEAVSGFFTKFGDGAADVTPLFGLTKRMVREIAAYLGAPERLVHKEATADLENDRPQVPDEEVLGVSYESIDAFLEGRDLPLEDERKIRQRYIMTQHKRRPPVTPSWLTDTEG